MPYCVFGTGISLFIVPLGWNRANMELLGTFAVIALLSFYGLYKTVRFLVGDTADEVEFDKNEKLPKALFIQFRFTFIMQCVIIFSGKMLQYLAVFGI